MQLRHQHPGYDHGLTVGGHGAHLDFGAGIGPLLLRVVLLAAVPIVVGFVLLRGFLDEPSRRTTVWVMGIAAAAVGMELLLSGGLTLPEQVVPLLLAALALPMYLIQSRDERFAAAVGLGRRLAPLIFGALAVLAAVQLGAGWLAGAGPGATATALHTGVLLGLVALVWFAAARTRGRRVTIATRAGAALLAMGLLAGTAQAITLRQPEPVPGVATAARLEVGPEFVDVVVVPNLPGRNLVHVGSATASVGTSQNDLAPVRSWAGAPGGWLEIELPAGPSEVWVSDAGQVDSVPTDTGGAGTAPRALTGADGPECASALLGGMVAAGAASDDLRCPSEQLAPADATALRELVASLAQQGHRRVAVAGDGSPRGLAATGTVRAAAAARGVELVPPGVAGVPLVLTSGWRDAGTLLRRVADGDLPANGTYLAPWLFAEPLQAIDAGQHVRFDASAESFQGYRSQLRAGYPAQPVSAVGYRAWLAERDRAAPATVSSTVD